MATLFITDTELENIADAIEKIVQLTDEEYQEYSKNAAQTSEKYDFKNLTHKLIELIEILKKTFKRF